MKIRFYLLVLLLAFVNVTHAQEQRLRIVIETDAGGDPDDEQSLVRFLLYSNEWDIEGIIANRAEARPGENLNPERTGLGIVRRLIDAYADCHPNLIHHDSRYPVPGYLRNITVAGYNDRNDGVRLLISAIDRPDPRPLWYSDWGTDHGGATNNLRRALDIVLRERGPVGYAQFKSKLRLTSADAFGPHTGSIAPPFKLFVNTFEPALAGRRWYHRFSALTSRAGGFDLVRDVLVGHGPLGSLYPTNTTHWAKEGDSMTFIYLLPTGLNVPEDPTLGSWAGRYGLDLARPHLNIYWANQSDVWQGSTNRDNSLARWAEALQNDFRARLNWCVTDKAHANHPPILKISGQPESRIRPGQSVTVDASETRDPDGNRLSFSWFEFPIVGNPADSTLKIEGATSATAIVRANDRSLGIHHLVLAVTDDGSPSLTRYARRRIVVATEN